MPFSEKALEILYAGGWSASRKMPTDGYSKQLIDAGFKLHTAALEFLAKFEGLRFSFNSKKFKNGIDDFNFDLTQAIAVADIDDIEDFGNCIGTKLVPIGQMNRGNSMIAIAEDGRIFSYFSPFISLMADNYVDAINGFCSEAKPIKTLPYDGGPLLF